MKKIALKALVFAFALGTAASASASVVLASDSTTLDINYKKLSLVSDPLDFSIGKNHTLVDVTLTFDPAAGNSGTIKSADAFLELLGKTHKLGSSDTLTTLKNGDVQVSFTELLNKGNYSLVDSFTLKNSWKGVVTAQVDAVPEPATYALMGLGLVGLMLSRRRRAGVSIPGNFA